MVSLQKTYYYCNIAIIVLLVGGAGCAGRQGGRVSESGRRATTPGAVRGLPGIREPIIRVGLKTDARSVTLESERELYVSDGGGTRAGGSRVTASPSSLSAIDASYSVQVESFSSKDNAEKARQALSSRTRRKVYLFHNADRNLEQLRVGPFGSREEAQRGVDEMKALGYSSAFYVQDDAGVSSHAELIVRSESGEVLLKTRNPVQVWAEDLTIRIDQDLFRGYATLFANNTGRVSVVNVLNFEDYLLGVVPNEIGGGSPETINALKAQAVAARTYAYKNLRQFDSDGYDICASPRCQVYSGMKNESALTGQAVEDTKGEVILYAGEPINALYTSTCGGRTENAEFMFEDMNYPYLKSVECYPEQKAAAPASAKLEGSIRSWWLSWLNAKTGVVVDGDMSQPLHREEAIQATSGVLRFLGKSSCGTEDLQDTNWVAIGNYLVGQLCWQARRDSLLTEKDYQYFLSHLNFSLNPNIETHSFLFLFHDNILVPEAGEMNRFDPYRPMKRVDFYRSLYQVLDHYHQINPSKGQAREVRPREIQIVDDLGVHLFQLDSPVYLYQMLNDGKIPREDLACSPGDRVEYLAEAGRITILACEISQAGAAVDRSSKYSFWQESVTSANLGQRVSKYANVGDVLDLQPLSYGVSGRVYQLKITGTKSSAVLSGIRVRWALGIKDNLFTIDRTFDSGGRVREFVFTGRGWGHGVGMCQVGALGYAKQGMDYKQILQHYYTGTQISHAW